MTKIDLPYESTLEFRSTFWLCMFHFSSCSLAYFKGQNENIQNKRLFYNNIYLGTLKYFSINLIHHK